MKTKLLRTMAAFCTALILMGGFSMTAYAGGGVFSELFAGSGNLPVNPVNFVRCHF